VIHVTISNIGGEDICRLQNGGQGRTRMWFWFKKSSQTRATWHRALSCWKTWSKFHCCRKGRTI